MGVEREGTLLMATKRATARSMRAEIERLRAQHLLEPWHRQDALGEARHERVEVWHRSGDDRERSDRETDVAIRVFGLQESRIKD
jgi:hypothetical protein